jgi:beta-1,4-mannosyl-glycoprotein beta-1,4-N-acetylglucosaminyltransferase
MSKPLIIDYIIYNGEPIVEYRLQYLNDYVDYFVLVESLYTHSGKKKPELYYYKNIDIFKKYEQKIIVKILETIPNKDDKIYQDIIKYEKLPEVKDSWINEIYNRNYIQQELLKIFDQPFIVLVCDADEIPRKELVQNIHTYYNRLNEGMHIQMYFLIYGFRWKKDIKWYHPFIINDIGTKNLSYSKVRLTFNEYFNNGGWHITACFSPNDIIRKLESFAHTEFDKENLKDKNFIFTCMLSGRSYLSRDKQDVLIPTNGNDLPDNWDEFQVKIDNMIFENEYPELKIT